MPQEEVSEGDALEFFTFLTELIQLYALSSVPRTLYLEGPQGVRGLVALDAGSLTHAQVGVLSGEDAFFEIATWRRGEILRQVSQAPDSRTIRRSLSKLLMDAFWYVESATKADEDTPASESARTRQTLDRPMSREMLDLLEKIEQGGEVSEVEIEEELSGRQRDWRRRVEWGEKVQRGLRELEGLVHFDLLDAQGEAFVHSDHDDVDAATAQLPTRMLGVLRELDMLDEQLVLTLSRSQHHHILMRLPTPGGFMLHAIFDREAATLGMAHFKLTQVLDASPQE